MVLLVCRLVGLLFSSQCEVLLPNCLDVLPHLRLFLARAPPLCGGPVPQSVFHQCVTVTLCLSVYLFSFTLSLLLPFPYFLFLFPRPSVPLFLTSSDSRSPLFSDFGLSYYFMFRFLLV